MEEFDPIRHVENAAAILDGDAWPDFHEAQINEMRFERRDIRPDENVWQAQWIEAWITLCVVHDPYDVRLRFESCEGIELRGFDNFCEIDDLAMSFKPRGFYRDNATPLTPHVRVQFVSFGAPSPFSLEFRCLRVVALGRAEVTRPS